MMASAEIKLNDEYINGIGSMFLNWSEILQKHIDDYLKIMNAILNDSIMEGETADAIKEFLSYAQNLDGIIKTLGEESKGLCVNYLHEIDEADSYLY